MERSQLLKDIQILRNLAESCNATWEIHSQLQEALRSFQELVDKNYPPE